MIIRKEMQLLIEEAMMGWLRELLRNDCKMRNPDAAVGATCEDALHVMYLWKMIIESLMPYQNMKIFFSNWPLLIEKS